MGDVGHEGGPDLVGDLAKRFEVDGPRKRRAAGDDQPGPMLARQIARLVQVDQLGVAANTIGHDGVEAAREVHGAARGQVSAVGQARREHGVAGLQQGEVHRHVGLGSGMRLDIHVLGGEQLLGPRDGQLLGDVHHLAPAVVAPARVALGVLVGEAGTGRLQHRLGHEVLRRDQLQVAGLPLGLGPDHVCDLGIDPLKLAHVIPCPAAEPRGGARGRRSCRPGGGGGHPRSPSRATSGGCPAPSRAP